jgi:DNA-binding transcriptional regulator GbsR (MarR family)
MDHAVRKFIERLGSHLADEGFPLIAGRVTAYLLVAEGPRSLDEIAGALSVSRASVSTDTRRLVDRGLLVRSSLPGDRRTYYTFAPDGFRTMLAARIRNLSTLRALLEDAAALPVARSTTEVRQRLTEWTDFHTAVIDLLQALLAKWSGRNPTTTRSSAVA